MKLLVVSFARHIVVVVLKLKRKFSVGTKQFLDLYYTTKIKIQTIWE